MGMVGTRSKQGTPSSQGQALHLPLKDLHGELRSGVPQLSALHGDLPFPRLAVGGWASPARIQLRRCRAGAKRPTSQAGFKSGLCVM